MESNPKALSLGTERVKPDSPTPETVTPSAGQKSLNEKIIDVLKTIYDPEVPVNIYELGLIYDIHASPEGDVHIKMTLTSPACPVAGSLPGEVESKVRRLRDAKTVKVELVWEPPWDKDKMSEAAQLQLGLF